MSLVHPYNFITYRIFFSVNNYCCCRIYCHVCHSVTPSLSISSLLSNLVICTPGFRNSKKCIRPQSLHFKRILVGVIYTRHLVPKLLQSASFGLDVTHPQSYISILMTPIVPLLKCECCSLFDIEYHSHHHSISKIWRPAYLFFYLFFWCYIKLSILVWIHAPDLF